MTRAKLSHGSLRVTIILRHRRCLNSLEDSVTMVIWDRHPPFVRLKIGLEMSLRILKQGVPIVRLMLESTSVDLRANISCDSLYARVIFHSF